MAEIYVIKTNVSDLAAIKEYYNGDSVENNEYLYFSSIKNKIKIEAYTSGKIVYKGFRCIDLINELPFSYVITKKPEQIIADSNKQYDEAIGSDEVGTGDVFGPIVVCSFYASKMDCAYLDSLGIMDSKKLTDEKILSLGEKIKDKMTYTVVVLNNTRYNNAIRKGNNMNRIKAVLHNKAIVDTINKVGIRPVILDQFCDPILYYRYLIDIKNVYRKITFKTKAESFHISVAAASVMARYTFLHEMKKLNDLVGMNLHKGASSLVDNQLKELISKKGMDFMSNIAKCNFKNFLKIKE